ncbi:MAG: hypothetical protein R6V76_08880 [Desulfobacterales bacterium]
MDTKIRIEQVIVGKDVMVNVTAIDDEDEASTKKLEIIGWPNQLLAELTPTSQAGKSYNYKFCTGSSCKSASDTKIDAKPGDKLTLKHGKLQSEMLVNGLKLGPILVGEKFEITLIDSNQADRDIVSVEVFAQYQTITRHQIRVTLTKDTYKAAHFSGKVATISGTGLQPDDIDTTLRVRANDTVKVKLNSGVEAEEMAQGINTSDILIDEPLTVEVLDPDLKPANKQQVTIEAKTSRNNQKIISITLIRDRADFPKFTGMLHTTTSSETDIAESTLQVHDGDIVELVYKKSEGKEVTWRIDVNSQRRVNLQVTGGVSSGKPLEILLTDLNRVDDLAVNVFIIQNRSSKAIEKRLERVSGASGHFRGIFYTADRAIEQGIRVKAGDEIDIYYLDGKNEFHQGHLTVMNPPELLRDFDWYKKYCGRAFIMPSLTPLLAELNCLELRLRYYRKKALYISESKTIDFFEDCLDRAAKALKDNKWDLTIAWKALHEAKREEIYLLQETEVMGREHQITAEGKHFLSDERQTKMRLLMEEAKKERKKTPGSNRWRGYVAEAIGMLQEQQDAYYTRHNMIRDRMVLITAILAIILAPFFYFIFYKTNVVADALVNNITLKQIISENSRFFYGDKDFIDDKNLAIRFSGETVVGQPLVVEVKDIAADQKNSIMATLRCTEETKSLCPPEDEQITLRKVSGSEGLFRSIIDTSEGDPKAKRSGYLMFKPGAEILAQYTATQTDNQGVSKQEKVDARTRMLDAKRLQDVEPSAWKIILAGCLLGAIGACLSTLMSLKSGSQIPNHLDSVMLSVVRPVIGFAAALLLFISLNAKLLNFDPTITMYFLLSFVSGFSDRLVLGVVSKIEETGKGSKETSKSTA